MTQPRVKSRIEEVYREIVSGTSDCYGTGHFHISNWQDSQFIRDTVSDMQAVYGFRPTEAAELMEMLKHG